MSGLNLRRWTGAFGIASSVLFLLLFVLYALAGITPRAEDAAKFTDYVSTHNSLLLTITLLYALSAACFVVFLSGLRHLIRLANPDYEWASVLVFAAGLVDVTLGLVGFVLLGGAVLDTVNNKPDPSVVSALGEASTLALAGIGLVTLALFLASAGYGTSGSGLLPRWTAWVAYVGAVVSLVAVPAIYAGSGPTAFYSADGYVTLIGVLVYLIWLLVAAVYVIVGRQQTARRAETKDC